MLTLEQLQEMSAIDITAVNKSELVNIEEVIIDTNLPAPERMLRYLEQIKNPYCFLCRETPVKISFAAESQELSEVIKRHFIRLKQ